VNKVAIFIPLHNEEAYIEKTVSSILAQDYQDFDLIVSENHSTDSSLASLRRLEAMDSRVKVIRPETKLNSHGNLCFVADHASRGEYFASMMVGGHDLLSHNVLSSAVAYLSANPGCAIAYQRDSLEIDEQDRATRRWPVCHESGHMNGPFDAILTLLSMMYNTPIFGLWRHDVRRKVAFRYPCVGGDHLYVAEAAVHGAITPIAGAQMYLRRSPPSANYLQKHFTEASGDAAAANDMYTQLSWLSDIIDQASAGYPNIARELFRTSAVWLYLLRYNHHFATFNSTLNAFAVQPGVDALIQGQIQMGGQIKALLKAKRGADAA
jgi:hypothetical protein